MTETSRLEKRTRELADEYMANHPGVPRQEAKRKVRLRAQFDLVRENIDSLRRYVLMRIGS